MKKVMQCMAHPEDTGSLVIDFEKETYHCLSCGIKGTIDISFRMIPDETDKETE